MESENIKLARHVSVKVEFAEVKAEIDNARHNITSGSGSRTSFALNIHFYSLLAMDTEYAPTGYERRYCSVSPAYREEVALANDLGLIHGDETILFICRISSTVLSSTNENGEGWVQGIM